MPKRQTSSSGRQLELFDLSAQRGPCSDSDKMREVPSAGSDLTYSVAAGCNREVFKAVSPTPAELIQLRAEVQQAISRMPDETEVPKISRRLLFAGASLQKEDIDGLRPFFQELMRACDGSIEAAKRCLYDLDQLVFLIAGGKVSQESYEKATRIGFTADAVEADWSESAYDEHLLRLANAFYDNFPELIRVRPQWFFLRHAAATRMSSSTASQKRRGRGANNAEKLFIRNALFHIKGMSTNQFVTLPESLQRRLLLSISEGGQLIRPLEGDLSDSRAYKG